MYAMLDEKIFLDIFLASETGPAFKCVNSVKNITFPKLCLGKRKIFLDSDFLYLIARSEIDALPQNIILRYFVSAVPNVKVLLDIFVLLASETDPTFKCVNSVKNITFPKLCLGKQKIFLDSVFKKISVQIFLDSLAESKFLYGMHSAMRCKIQFCRYLSLEINHCRLPYFFDRKLGFTLQIGDHFFLTLNSGYCCFLWLFQIFQLWI